MAGDILLPEGIALMSSLARRSDDSPAVAYYDRVRGNLRYGRHGRDVQTRFGFDAVVDLLGIAPLLARPTRNLSGGEAQRVAIGRALLSQPAVLLFDEPLSSLDLARREELIPYLQRVRDEIRLPIVYVSHHAEEVRRLADAVHVME